MKGPRSGGAWFRRKRDWLANLDWAWTVRWATVLAFVSAIAGWFFGIGLDKVPEYVFGGLKGNDLRVGYWIMGVGFAIAAVLYLVTFVAWYGRRLMMRTNGTAFVVMEKSADWTRRFDHGDFYAQARRRFARIVEVPGPDQLGSEWAWPLDGRARYWEDRFAELLASFRALYLAETTQTDGAEPGATGVFVTAPQPVAMALGYRLRAVVLDLVLDVWQRPSNLRGGQVDPVIWGQRGHRYTRLRRLPRPESILSREEHAWDVTLTVDRSDADPELPVPATDGPVSVLLVRFGAGAWGELPAVGDQPGAPGPVDVTLHDLAGVIPGRDPAQIQLHELRCVPADQIAWEDSPYLVNEAVTWIQQKARELRGHTLFLATAMPNDVAIGIGLAAGLPACDNWPDDLWPIVYRNTKKTCVVPRLNLGRSATIEPGA